MKIEIKRTLSLILCAVLITALFAGCSGKEDSGAEKNETEPAAASQTTEVVDVDLTKLSTTMVYSELANMMNDPSSYEGKTVKMQGQFMLTENTETGQQYYNVTVMDATACCQQGIEFIWTGHTYPDDYPAVNSTIEVTGVFETYDEDGMTYCHLISDNVEVV